MKILLRWLSVMVLALSGCNAQSIGVGEKPRFETDRLTEGALVRDGKIDLIIPTGRLTIRGERILWGGTMAEMRLSGGVSANVEGKMNLTVRADEAELRPNASRLLLRGAVVARIEVMPPKVQ